MGVVQLPPFLLQGHVEEAEEAVSSIFPTCLSLLEKLTKCKLEQEEPLWSMAKRHLACLEVTRGLTRTLPMGEEVEQPLQTVQLESVDRAAVAEAPPSRRCAALLWLVKATWEVPG